jgi:RES domain-containing protein
MEIYRFVLKRFSNNAFGGKGGELFPGRWHSKGKPIVYCSATPSLALLEGLVNTTKSELIKGAVLIPAAIPKNIKTMEILENSLPKNWRQYPSPQELRFIGDDWLLKLKSPVLIVPSAVVPIEKNYLLNPLHPDFSKIIIGKTLPMELDPRLL